MAPVSIWHTHMDPKARIQEPLSDQICTVYSYMDPLSEGRQSFYSLAPAAADIPGRRRNRLV